MANTKRIVTNGSSEVIIKKSRFLGVAAAAFSPEEAADVVKRIKTEHYAARHNCYAYSVGMENPQKKFSDDGEPGGTAGRPMMDVIDGSGISDIVVVVTRYFGGVLLGTGGLVRAYKEACEEAIKNCIVKEVAMCDFFQMQVDYADFEPMKYIIEDCGGEILDSQYAEKITIQIAIAEELSSHLQDVIRERSAGRLSLELIKTELR